MIGSALLIFTSKRLWWHLCIGHGLATVLTWNWLTCLCKGVYWHAFVLHTSKGVKLSSPRLNWTFGAQLKFRHANPLRLSATPLSQKGSGLSPFFMIQKTIQVFTQSFTSSPNRYTSIHQFLWFRSRRRPWPWHHCEFLLLAVHAPVGQFEFWVSGWSQALSDQAQAKCDCSAT